MAGTGGKRKYGRNKAKCERYRAKRAQRRERIYKRVKKSCGRAFADKWRDADIKKALGNAKTGG